ncbi:MAG: hypothetical protein PHE84_04070 [bacterium]|nr:hypothetical protein [bacterium]
MTERLSVFEKKIEEYFLSCLPPTIVATRDKSFLAEWPLYKFSIVRLHTALDTKLDDKQLSASVGEKLIDIKLHFAYLLTVMQHFYRGVTEIVGNNEIEKLNPKTISLLREIHYRVYLLSVLIEQVLDLLWLVMERKPSNHKRGKWKKIIERVQLETGQAILIDGDAELLLKFNEQFRTSELHKFSMIRAFTGKPQWTHLQDEEQAAGRVLQRLFEYFVKT